MVSCAVRQVRGMSGVWSVISIAESPCRKPGESGLPTTGPADLISAATKRPRLQDVVEPQIYIDGR